MSLPLLAGDLAVLLKDCALAREILVFEKTNSTNDVAAQLGREGAAEGVVVFAETQTAGRGRLGRTWESAAREGLWFSMLLRPSWPREQWTRLATWAAVGIARGLEAVLGQPAAIKWPNDIYFDHRKAVGILIETHGGENGFAVLGMGVNVNQASFSDSLAGHAVSLRQIAGHLLDRQQVAVAILRELDGLYPKLPAHFAEILAAAEARNYLRGRRVETESAGGRVSGIAETLDENGALVLRKPDGGRVLLTSGEASIARR